MDHMSIFPTLLWRGESELDNFRLRDLCYDHQKKVDGEQVSNVGGYQGHKFFDEKFDDEIIEQIPRVEGKEELPPMHLFSWVNINGKGHYNEPHTHFNQMTPIFLSGVYYVSVPEDSGVIRFFDPRGTMVGGSIDQDYYFNSQPFAYVEPEDGMFLFFPSWLEHDVTQNHSDEDRISISFNVLVGERQEK